MQDDEYRSRFHRLIDNPENPYHPLAWIRGEPEIGAGTYIGGFSEINAKGARVVIGSNCDIASFVAINVADSHRRAIGLATEIQRRDIFIGNYVFIGTHSAVLGGANIGVHSVVAAGTVVRSETIPPFSLVFGNPATVKAGYYADAFQKLKIGQE